MEDWTWLRTIAAVAAWGTVGGGLVLAAIWFAAGGAKAAGPEEDLMPEGGSPPRRRAPTSFTSAQVGVHGLFGVMTAAFLTYVVVAHHDLVDGYLGALVAVALTATLGILMYRKWSSGELPRATRRARDGGAPARPEDKLPRAVVYLHGAAAATTALLVVVLLVIAI